MQLISEYFIPILFIAILIVAFIKKIKPYDAFTEGAKSAIPLAVNVFPYLVSIFVLTSLMESSGLSNIIANTMSPVFSFFGIPKELTKLVIIKPFSGSGSLATLADIFSTYGVDSYLARASCVVYGSSETVFYIATVYFACIKEKHLVTPIVISLIASFCSCSLGCIICHFI